ncbi:MAG: Xylulokinase [Massilibacillus sp.]|jgi:xylulokinase|nr:Xylulokinase [Massilibacillus sp.]
MSKILVLNMGMKSIRSIIFNSNGEKLASASKEIETFLSEEFVLQDPAEWWEKAGLVIRESLRDLKKEKIEYITVTTSSACLVYVDKNCRALDKCIMVSDKRAKAESEELKKAEQFSKVKENTGLESDPYLMLPKILWVKNNQPDAFGKTYKFLSPNDFFIAKMTGQYVTDCFNAQKYHFDTKSNSYPIELLDELEIDKKTLPKVVAPGTIVGRMNETVATCLGLNQDIQVVVTSYDAICSFFGSGVSDEGDASDVSGTVTVFRALSKQKSLQPSSKILTMPFHKWNIDIVGGSNNLGGGLIEWVKQCYYQNEKYPYEVMEKDAGESLLGAGGLIFLPYLLGERAPVWNNEARGVFFGLERMHTRKEMTRAVFESAGFIDMDMMQAIEETGVKVNTIRLSGGLARINLISQIKADITGKDVLVLSEFETTATGAAMLALIGAGEFTDLKVAADCFASVRMIIKPNKVNHQKYQEIFGLYKDTYATVKDLFRKRLEVVNHIYPKREVKIENL